MRLLDGPNRRRAEELEQRACGLRLRGGERDAAGKRRDHLDLVRQRTQHLDAVAGELAQLLKRDVDVAARDEASNRGVQLFMGNRKASRKDTAWRKFQSSIANGVRSSLLRDDTPDTGCGIKLFSRDLFMELPRFDHMHRLLPALFQRHGARVVSVPVSHRPRLRGTSKYGMLNRLWVGIVDICGVMWLRRRYKPGLLVREE